MTKSDSSATTWAVIEREQRRDRLLRWVSMTAWSLTGLTASLFTILMGIAFAPMVRDALAGTLPWVSLVGFAYPLVIVVGMTSLFVGSVTTIGLFLRQRTASLLEIQSRLATLEDALTRGSRLDN